MGGGSVSGPELTAALLIPTAQIIRSEDVLAAIPAMIGIDFFRANAEVILPLFFIGFFLAAFVAIFTRNDRARTTFLAGFFVLLLVINVSGFFVLPLVHWQKFSKPQPATETFYEFQVVDAEGRELQYDYRATLSVDGVTMRLLREKMLTEYSPAKKEEVGCYFLDRARAYRDRVTGRSSLHLFRFPPHGIQDTWTEAQLDGYARFVGIRYYKVTVTTSPDGSRIVDRSRQLLFEYRSVNRSMTSCAELPPEPSVKPNFQSLPSVHP